MTTPAPRPGPTPGASPAPPPAPPSGQTAGDAAASTPSASDSGTSDATSWGRVADDGSVYVRVGDGERLVGQWLGGDAAEGLDFFARKYDALVFELDLLAQRIAAGTLAPGEAAKSLAQVRAAVEQAQVVGDLAALDRRLEELDRLLAKRREEHEAERAKKLEEARETKTTIAAEAERLAEGNDWRGGADRLRQLLDQWKELPRLDKATDDALWRRFSTARTTYTRRRKAHFAELGEKREQARAVKEKLITEAEALSGSTEWGPTTVAYRDLMRRWKAAGPAPKKIDDQLWQRFRAAQDTFFQARDAANAATEAEFAENAKVKEALLVEAEALLPVSDARAARESFRRIGEKWDAAGKVPRNRVKELEGRLRKVDQAIRAVEDEAWRRSNPEARARAADTVAQLETSIAELEKLQAAAEESGNSRKAADHAAAIEARKLWLAEARKALDEFTT